MSELTMNQIERIDRALMSRRKKRELTAVQKFDNWIVFFFFCGVTIIFAALFLVNAEWQPGRQQEIAAEYKATRHNATPVDWK